MDSYSTLLILLAIGIAVAYAVSRLLLFLSRRWDGGYVRILVANATGVPLEERLPGMPERAER